MADHTVEFKCDVTFTDAAFWNIFNFRFLSGKPYGEEEVQSGIMDAVVSESVARRLYGTTEVVGRTVEISYVPYTIRAVVRDVSLLAESAYGDVWLPYTPTIPCMIMIPTVLSGASVVISSQVRPPT